MVKVIAQLKQKSHINVGKSIDATENYNSECLFHAIDVMKKYL